MLRILTDDPDDSLTTDNLAIFTQFLNRRSYFHFMLLTNFTYIDT
jgi:hypothetical protein